MRGEGGQGGEREDERGTEAERGNRHKQTATREGRMSYLMSYDVWMIVGEKRVRIGVCMREHK